MSVKAVSLFDQKYNKTVKYYYNVKQLFFSIMLVTKYLTVN